MSEAPLQCPCQSAHFRQIHVYDAPPEGEIRFTFASQNYHRELLQCTLCRHFISRHHMTPGMLYDGDYVDATYGGEDGLRRTFERIIALAPGKSDNIGRATRIAAFAAAHFGERKVEDPGSIKLLDVGAGLGVFPHKIKQMGWDCTALDPDPRAVKHMREVVQVNTVQADFMTAEDLGQYDVITFNKVLEHLLDPVTMLKRALKFLKPRGFVYVEVPDGEQAIKDGAGREEFFIDHLHIFSMASAAMLAERGGFTVEAMERLQEPSTKYTLCAFLTINQA